MNLADDSSLEDADFLAEVLNKTVNVTFEALVYPDVQNPAQVMGAIREFREAFAKESPVGQFLDLLLAWLAGQTPSYKTAEGLEQPFRDVLLSMIKDVRKAKQRGGDKEQPPISGNVLAQLMTAVIAATRTDNAQVKRELASQLINVHGQLNKKWKAKIGPLLDNLRAILGGTDPQKLPPIPDPHYQNLWSNAVELLLHADLSADKAEDQLLERLVHNTHFTRNAQNNDLTESFLRALLDVQRQALGTGATHIAMLVTAIRAYLQGSDPSLFAAQLEGASREAWQRIVGKEESAERGM